jgi:antitoxin (DNA-binding transcriptional repressor) of toxin-antitoxin stability system
MLTVGLKVLKSRLREYISLVSAGETVLVMDRDRIVAELRPPQGRDPLTSDALLAEAMRRGWLSAPLIVGEGIPLRSPVSPLAELVRELNDDREDR